MKANLFSEAAPGLTNGLDRPRVPVGLKWAYTVFMLVLVPVYWANYGPTDFINFCDTALFLTLAAVWMDAADGPHDDWRLVFLQSRTIDL